MNSLKETDPQAYHHLASFLRRNPDAINQDPSLLSDRFGVPRSVVVEVLDSVKERVSRRSGDTMTLAKNPVSSMLLSVIEGAIVPAGRKVRKGWYSTTSSPSWFVGISTAISILVIFLLSQSFIASHELVKIEKNGISITTKDAAGLITVVATIILQFFCYYRHGMARYALYGALVNWLISSVLSIVTVWYSAGEKAQNDISTATMTLAIAFGLLLVAAIYAGIGVVFAVLGAFVALNKAEARKEQLSRQELLERMFEIEEKLRQGSSEEALEFGLASNPLIRKVSSHPMMSTLALGFGLGILHPLVLGTIHLISIRNPQNAGLEMTSSFVWIVLGISWFLGEAMVGFVNKRFAQSFAACMLFAAAYTIPLAIPYGGYGPARVSMMYPHLLGAMLLFIPALAYISCLGATVEEKATRNRGLRKNDPGALLSELLDIQYLLTPETQEVCVLVVDVARSADMKTAADPFVVEYSFREYQHLVADISDRYRGTVHSTAGDGAVVAFPSCAEGFGAAKRIQTEIDDFNRETNRLRAPFRLRIGLHRGQVQGDIGKVQFTEVIDIAAHVQSVAPVGGIAMTEAVATELGDEPAVQLRDKVDGQTVMLVLNPTLDQ